MLACLWIVIYLVISSWWLNQPIWEIWSSNWIISPGRDENKQYLSCQHLVIRCPLTMPCPANTTKQLLLPAEGWPFRRHERQRDWLSEVKAWTQLVGGFNIIEKHESKWESSPIFGVNIQKYLKPAPRQQWMDPFLKKKSVNTFLVLSKNDASSSSFFLLSSLGCKKPSFLLHQKTKMICDLFLCLQLGLWWNAWIGTWGGRNANQKTTQQLDAFSGWNP